MVAGWEPWLEKAHSPYGFAQGKQDWQCPRCAEMQMPACRVAERIRVMIRNLLRGDSVGFVFFNRKNYGH
jgi:hypothetical protein